jgi:hypothetical protein
MPADTFACPECAAVLRRSGTLEPGEAVMCPRCRREFPCPAPETNPATSGPAGWRTSIPPVAYTRTPIDDVPLPTPQRDIEEDEDHPRRNPFDVLRIDDLEPAPVHFGDWLHLANKHWHAFAVPAAGYCVAAGLISLAVLFVPFGAVFGFFLLPQLQAGLSVVALAQLTGRRWTFRDFFSGYYWGWQTIGVAFYTLLLSLLILPASFAVLVFLDEWLRFGEDFRGSDPLLLWSIIALVGYVLFAVLYTRLLSFALPLVLDRNYPATEALGASWVLSRGHFWKLLGLNLLTWSVNLLGALCFGVGLLLTLPFTVLVWNAGYLLVAGARPPVSGAEAERES